MALSGSQTTRFGIRGIMERLAGSFAGKEAQEVGAGGIYIPVFRPRRGR